MKIKTKKDAKEFVIYLKEKKTYGNHSEVFRFYDCIYNSNDITIISRDEEGNFYMFSRGDNWEDQARYYIDDIERAVWDYRKQINAFLREG